MKIIILRPSVASEFKLKELSDAFRDMKLIDKTIVEDRIIYIFKSLA